MWQIIDCNHEEDWQDWARSCGGDVYYSLGYHQVYRFAGGTPLAYCANIQGEKLFHPFIRTPVRETGLFDLESVYGYSGPLATSDDPAFLTEAFQGFDQWATGNNIVSEFIRFHPLLQSHHYGHPKMDLIKDRKTVAINLDQPEDALWADYEPAMRNRIKKAGKEGLVCTQTKGDITGDFIDIYKQTMKHVDAADFYFFNDDYFNSLVDNLADTLCQFTVSHQGEAIAAAIFMGEGDYLHYHLGGSHPEYRTLAPNNLLFHTAICWGAKNGFKQLHLGGGRTNAPDDDLFRFKRRFSKSPASQVPFFIGKRIHDLDAYKKLADQWCEDNDKPQPKGHLQFYRT